jgi:hypothetical protein
MPEFAFAVGWSSYRCFLATFHCRDWIVLCECSNPGLGFRRLYDQFCKTTCSLALVVLSFSLGLKLDQTQIIAIELDRVPNIGFLLIDEVIHSFRPKEKPSIVVLDSLSPSSRLEGRVLSSSVEHCPDASRPSRYVPRCPHHPRRSAAPNQPISATPEYLSRFS